MREKGMLDRQSEWSRVKRKEVAVQMVCHVLDRSRVKNELQGRCLGIGSSESGP